MVIAVISGKFATKGLGDLSAIDELGRKCVNIHSGDTLADQGYQVCGNFSGNHQPEEKLVDIVQRKIGMWTVKLFEHIIAIILLQIEDRHPSHLTQSSTGLSLL